MDAIETLKQDVKEGRIKPERLIDLIVSLQQQLQAALQQLQAAQQRIEELEKKLGGPPTTKVDEAYSMRAEERRKKKEARKKRKQKGRGGRLKTKDKIALAKRTEQVYPDGSSPSECYLSHTRPVWRLENHRAVLIAYEIYRNSAGKYGRIPGVLGRSEFGLEIVVEVAHLVYVVGLSFDKVCQLLHFFQELKLTKAQVNALLHQLSRHWEQQFEVLCTLLANSLVVNTDETSWSINSVWAFLSEKARVVLFGVNKDAETLQKILDPAAFEGIVVSDDYAVYAGFNQSQKCWAHLLRKAIKLALQDPNNAEYSSFKDRLLEIYREACRVKRDSRLSDAGREKKVSDLELEVFELCGPTWNANLPKSQGLADDYRLLVNEVMRLTLYEQLFTFVTAEPVVQPNGEEKPVGGTNNESERTLRGPAQARDTGRTNKTRKGARRQTILTSVLESLRLYLPTFTLATVVEELRRWQRAGRSCFEKLLNKLKLKLPCSDQSTLDRLFAKPTAEPAPVPSG
jgi:transposase